MTSVAALPVHAAPKGAAQPVPFASAEEAWLWTMAAHVARRDGTTMEDQTPRPCEVDDVIRILDQLYRSRRIGLAHAKVLRVYGEIQTAPRSTYGQERADARLWTEAMTRLAGPLRQKGIIR
ncbi:conserved protein of unknown function (plasmid) [Rhodovastum atsumiense]|uniref:Uncharacterized protein n=1 Tax=Rhodovastum atsumiense TaxID=504468 RepID=A0A5M6IN68_9PROT|nr:hypothetical protein [Rhodovastum atsumiense]KAA5609694.1 hypothetical protein F1189_23325 [Rhodovastum atsumiense]CAH2606475.1 conserved protein of unknown function [Rhodovastum atsumiense]